MALTNKLTAIGDAIRAKTGKTDALTLDAMVTEIGSISGGGSDAFISIDSDWNMTGSIEEVPDKFLYCNVSSVQSILNSQIKSVNFPNATSVGVYAFPYCAIPSFTLPALTTAGNNAFNNCSQVTSFDLPALTTAGNYAFSSCSSLTSLDLPALTTAGNSAFNSCSSLTSLDLPALTTAGNSAFNYCSSLTSLDLPALTTAGNYAFRACSLLEKIDLPVLEQLNPSLFGYCYSLKTVILRKDDAVVPLANVSAFEGCSHILGTVEETYNPEGLKDGYIYVPDALVDEYKAADNWSTYADQIKPLSELPTE